MDYKYIIQLLERYWKCETTLEEEEILRTFFSQDKLPAELETYKPLFAYEQGETKNETLGADFDQRMMDLIEEEEGTKASKPKVYSLTERLKPLFKAAAVVAIFLTLGNAMQVPFQNNADYVGNVETIKAARGASVAMGDSTSVDSMKHTSLDQVTSEPSPTILKR